MNKTVTVKIIIIMIKVEDRFARIEALKLDKKLEEVRNNKILGPKYHFRDVKSEHDSGYYYYYCLVF